jgi:hypothetical protein
MQSVKIVSSEASGTIAINQYRDGVWFWSDYDGSPLHRKFSFFERNDIVSLIDYLYDVGEIDEWEHAEAIQSAVDAMTRCFLVKHKAITERQKRDERRKKIKDTAVNVGCGIVFVVCVTLLYWLKGII